MFWLIIKHFICDWVLQTNYIARNKCSSVLVMTLHCCINACGTLIYILIVKPELAYLALIDLISHFIIDTIKCRLNLKNRAFWIGIGLDQTLHLLISYYIVVTISVI
jgi:hypothetical protein